MRRRAFLTAGITVAVIGTASAAALSLGGELGDGGSAANVAGAAYGQYGTHISTSVVTCLQAGVSRQTRCNVLVVGSTSVQPTGTVSFSGSQGGAFKPPACKLAPPFANLAACAVGYAPASGINLVVAAYSGDAVYAPSAGRAVVVGPPQRGG